MARPQSLHEFLKERRLEDDVHLELLQLSQSRALVHGDFLPSRILVEHFQPPLRQCLQKSRPATSARNNDDLEDFLGLALGESTPLPESSGSESLESDASEDSEDEPVALLREALVSAVDAESRPPQQSNINTSAPDLVAGSELDSDSDVIAVWEVRDLVPAAAPNAGSSSSTVRPAAGPGPLPQLPRSLHSAAVRRDRRDVPKIEIGNWKGSALYLNLTQTYGCSWLDMRAVCKRHETCSLSRSCRQARPLGLLVAWLQYGMLDSCRTKAQHRSYNPSHEQRVQARNWFKSLPGSEEWLSAEAPQSEGPEEPEI